LSSWAFGCIHPIAMILLEDPLGLDSGTLILPCLVGFCGGHLSVPVAFVTGALSLNKYRDEATKGDRTMAIVGMLLGGLMLLATVALTVIGVTIALV